MYVLPLFVAEVALRAFFPEFRDLIHDWASFTHWFLTVLAGFAVARHTSVLDNIERLRHISLGLAVVSTGLLFSWFYHGHALTIAREEPLALFQYIVFCALRMLMVWSVILSCAGYASRYLQRPGRTLRYLNEAVYPLFVLPLTLVIAFSFVAVPWPVDWWWKFLFVSNATLVSVLLTYHYAIRPYGFMRILFGMRATRQRAARKDQ